MMGKDESVTSKEGLSTTKIGRSIIRAALFKSGGYKMFNRYREETAEQMPRFERRFVEDLLREIKSDGDAAATQQAFSEEIGTDALALPSSQIDEVRARMSTPETLADRVHRILDSNFVKMTFPVFNALYDAAAHSDREDSLKQDMVEGHILAIDLSEPMDRIVDMDEDVEFLDDYRLLNPYILRLARNKIAKGGDAVLAEFEKGFADARTGQYVDEKLKSTPLSITEMQMDTSYKKYRAVMGTAGRNMALAANPLGEIYYTGMAHAAEAVGCGNEIEDSVRDMRVKVPSWPLYYSVLCGDVKQGFEMTFKRSQMYLSQARLSLEILPTDFTHTDFLKFLFMTVEHYTEFWYNKLGKLDVWDRLQESLPVNQT